MFLRSARSLVLTFVLAASVAPLAACSGSASVTEPSTTAQTSTTTAPLNVTVTGPAKRIAEALGQVPLRADQRATIEQMAKDSEARLQPMRQARAELVLAIADQVQAGAIDRAALQPKIDALTSAHQSIQPQNRAALEKLHALLTPDQRIAFVTAMQSHPREHAGRRAAMRGRMEKWATDLNLTSDQQSQIREKIRAQWQTHVVTAVVGTDEQKSDAIQDGQLAMRGHEAHERMQKILDAFKGATFSMDQVAPVQNERPMTNQFAGRILSMLEAALPVLTPDQRASAAQKLRQRASSLEDEELGAPAK